MLQLLQCEQRKLLKNLNQFSALLRKRSLRVAWELNQLIENQAANYIWRFMLSSIKFLFTNIAMNLKSIACVMQTRPLWTEYQYDIFRYKNVKIPSFLEKSA